MNQESSETKVGLSGRLKAVIEATGITKFEPEVAVSYDQALRLVVQYFHDAGRISDISFKLTELNMAYNKIIAEVIAKHPAGGYSGPIGIEKAKSALKFANQEIEETLKAYFDLIEIQLNLKK